MYMWFWCGVMIVLWLKMGLINNGVEILGWGIGDDYDCDLIEFDILFYLWCYWLVDGGFGLWVDILVVIVVFCDWVLCFSLMGCG